MGLLPWLCGYPGLQNHPSPPSPAGHAGGIPGAAETPRSAAVLYVSQGVCP